jgi:hypothetical protein
MAIHRLMTVTAHGIDNKEIPGWLVAIDLDTSRTARFVTYLVKEVSEHGFNKLNPTSDDVIDLYATSHFSLDTALNRKDKLVFLVQASKRFAFLYESKGEYNWFNDKNVETVIKNSNI